MIGIARAFENSVRGFDRNFGTREVNHRIAIRLRRRMVWLGKLLTRSFRHWRNEEQNATMLT